MEAPKTEEVALERYVIQCGEPGLSAELKIPRVNCSIGERDPKLPIKAYADQHVAFRLAVDQFSKDATTKRAAMAELEAVEATFPGLSEPTVTLSMAAWLYFLCAIDDAVEDTKPGAGKRALRGCIRRIKPKRPNGRISNMVYCRPSLGRKARFSPSADDTVAARVRFLAVSFDRHISSLLRRSHYCEFMTQVVTVLEAMIAEIRFRHTRSTNANEYLRIRAITIGLKPFFYLLRVDLQHEQSCSSTIELLQRHVSGIVGMQNELVGLKKDLKNEEWMNYVVILRLHGIPVHTSIQKAVDLHNQMCIEAVQVWNDMRGSASAQDIVLGTKLLGFIGRHLSWALTAKRYKP